MRVLDKDRRERVREYHRSRVRGEKNNRVVRVWGGYPGGVGVVMKEYKDPFSYQNNPKGATNAY